MNTEGASILLPGEAEGYVQSLQRFELKKIGCKKWSQQHEYLEKLNMQAVVSASAMQDEFVKEFLITYDKLPVLIHELICVEVWKEKVFPEFVNLDLKQMVLFPVYMVVDGDVSQSELMTQIQLYHEATVANLLETVLYHQEASEAAGDAILDLVDYCYRKLTMLCARSEEETEDDEEEDDSKDALMRLQNSTQVTTLEELQRQDDKLKFDICVKAISILRYITDHLSSLPMSVASRLLNTHDIPILLVQLVTSPPWTKNTDGKLMKYVDNKWQVVPEGNRFQLTKIEGQVWIALYHVLMDEECQRKYEISSSRKNAIIKLRPHLTEIMLDQMPILGELQRYLEQLSFMEPPAVKRDLVLEQIPEIQEKILHDNAGKWAQIAKKQSDTFFNPNKSDMREQARRLAETYSFDVLESLITEPPKCAVCGEEAAKRCSRCQNEWYCRRECQVGHWKKHKKACDLLVDALQKTKEQEQAAKS